MAMRYIACSKRSNAKVNIHFRRALNINDDCSYSPPPSFSCPMHEVYIVLSANTNQIIDANKYIQFCWKPIHARTQIIVTRKNSLSLTNDFPKWDLSHNVPPCKTGARSVWWKCDSDSTEVMHINGKYHTSVIFHSSSAYWWQPHQNLCISQAINSQYVNSCIRSVWDAIKI